jgi:hypothetical protein
MNAQIEITREFGENDFGIHVTRNSHEWIPQRAFQAHSICAAKIDALFDLSKRGTTESFQCRLTLPQSGRVKHCGACRNYNDFICAAKVDALFDL